MNNFWQMANLWNGLNACGWQGRTGKENEKTRIYQGCQRDILKRKVPPANPKVGRRLVWRSNPSPV